MRWIRNGQIYDPRQHGEWAGTHAQVPTVLFYSDRIRVFYADRTPENKSFITFLDIDRRDFGNILYCHKAPILPPGAFDDDGMMPGTAVRDGRSIYLYYTGWNRGVTVPYRNSIGVAVSDDDGVSFRRLYDGPVIDRNAREPHMAVTPHVLREGGLWRMWYSSGLGWTDFDGRLEPVYVIKDATSCDGVVWDRPNRQCIPQAHELEAFAHPSVIKHGDRYRMWYCFRGSRDYRDGDGAYRIGYAESADGVNWERMDKIGGLDVAPEGWDSTMTCYPSVFEIDGRIAMIYNGNGFGQTGFGYAILEDDR
jgi:sucrose-6-phosphate hydrolase SacC (GH32 family)